MKTLTMDRRLLIGTLRNTSAEKRAEYLAEGLHSGWLTLAEARQIEGLPPLRKPRTRFQRFLAFLRKGTR